MTTTLSEGVKVPDVGSVNWAGDLEVNWNLLNGALANLSGNVKTDGGASFRYANVYAVTFTGDLTGTASKAISDEDGTSIKTGYVNVAGNQTVTGDKSWTGEQTFSQTIQGNAATASAFDTAKSITLTGAVTGTVSGTNSWEITTALKIGSAATGGTVTNPYFKIASWEVAPNDYFGAILQIQNKFYPYQIATLTIGLRTKTDATFQRGYSLLNNAIGIQSSAFILCYKEITGKVLCELYYYTTTPFNGIRFSVISEGTRNDSSVFNTMVVYQGPTGIAALPSDYTTIQTSIGTYSQDFIPYATNTYSLGSSSYQWASVYSQTYYYNGTAWGLDKANTWTGNNTFTSTITTKTNVDRAVAPSSDTTYGTIICRDKNNSAMFRMQGTIKTDLSNVWDMMMVAPNNSYITFFRYTISTVTSDRELRFKADSVIPDDNSTSKLGTSTNKWKTLNGVNPGALSLPGASNAVSLDTTNVSMDGTYTYLSVSVNGWLYIALRDTTGKTDGELTVFIGETETLGSYSRWATNFVCSTDGNVRCFIPVLANNRIRVRINPNGGSPTDLSMTIYPCLGNV